MPASECGDNTAFRKPRIVTAGLYVCRYKVPYVETSALTADNIEESLFAIVRDIMDDSSSASGTVSPPRISVDFASLTKGRESSTSSGGSGGSGGKELKKGEKCVVS